MSNEPTSLARPEDFHAFHLPKHKQIAVSRHDGVATGNDGSRQDMSIVRIPKVWEPATLLVRFSRNGFSTNQRENVLRLFSKPGELLPHDIQDLLPNILGDDEGMFPAESGQENPPLRAGEHDARNEDVGIEKNLTEVAPDEPP